MYGNGTRLDGRQVSTFRYSGATVKPSTWLLVLMLLYFGAHILFGSIYCQQYICVGEQWEDLDAVEERQQKELTAR